MPNVTVTTTPTLLCAALPPSRRGWVLVEVPAGGVPVHVGLGDAAVTPTTGHELAARCTLLAENDAHSKPASHAFYAVTAAGTQEVIVSEGL